MYQPISHLECELFIYSRNTEDRSRRQSRTLRHLERQETWFVWPRFTPWQTHPWSICATSKVSRYSSISFSYIPEVSVVMEAYDVRATEKILARIQIHFKSFCVIVIKVFIHVLWGSKHLKMRVGGICWRASSSPDKRYDIKWFPIASLQYWRVRIACKLVLLLLAAENGTASATRPAPALCTHHICDKIRACTDIW